MKFDIVVVTYKRSSNLARCLQSLIDDHRVQKIIVVVNGEDSESELIARSLSAIEVLSLKNSVTPGEARNLGVKMTSSPLIYFIDDDAALVSGMVTRALDFFQNHPDAMVLGGPDLPFPNAPFLEYTTALAQRSPLATASTRYRHGEFQETIPRVASERELILCNLWIKKEAIDRVGGFDPRFARNEENVWLAKASSLKLALWYDPGLIVHHRKKPLGPELSHAVVKSGHFRMQALLLNGKTGDFPYLAPLAFLFYLIALVLFPISSFPLKAYLILNLFCALNLVMRRQHPHSRLGLLPAVMAAQALITLSYGIGLLTGLLVRMKPEQN
jgi:GT2 family glycosyltransferase